MRFLEIAVLDAAITSSTKFSIWEIALGARPGEKRE
jgi:hypothetical protein